MLDGQNPTTSITYYIYRYCPQQKLGRHTSTNKHWKHIILPYLTRKPRCQQLRHGTDSPFFVAKKSLRKILFAIHHHIPCFRVLRWCVSQIGRGTGHGSWTRTSWPESRNEGRSNGRVRKGYGNWALAGFLMFD